MANKEIDVSLLRKHKLLILFVASIIFLAALTSIWGGFSSGVSFLLLLIIPSILIRKKVRYLYQLSFLVYTLIMVFMMNNFQMIQGSYYVTNMAKADDIIFYEMAAELASKGPEELDKIGALESKMRLPRAERNMPAYYHHFSLMKPIAYVYTLYSWFKVLNFIGIQDNSPLHGVFLNIMGASLSIVVLYLILLLYISKDLAKKISIQALFFVPFIYMGASLIRDSWILLAHLLTIYLLCRPKYRMLSRFVYIPILLLYVYYYRHVSAAFLSIFIILYLYFSIANPSNRKIVFGLLFIGLLVGAALFFDLFWMKFMYGFEMYNALISETLGEDSLGRRITTSTNPLMILISPIYILFSPIPPKVFKVFNLDTMFLAIGSIQRYLLYPAFIMGCIKFWNGYKFSHLVKSFSLGFLILLALITFTSREERHLYPFYPLLISIGFLYVYKFYKKILTFEVYKIYFSTFFIGVICYMFIKLF